MLTRTALALAACVLGTAAASAQIGPTPLGPPVTSPYLNLLRPGSPTFLNYYGLVRPELQLRAQQGLLQNQVTGLNENLTSLSTASGSGQGLGSDLATGHGFGFQTHRQYFLNAGGGGQAFGLTRGIGGFSTGGIGGFNAGGVRGGAAGFGNVSGTGVGAAGLRTGLPAGNAPVQPVIPR